MVIGNSGKWMFVDPDALLLVAQAQRPSLICPSTRPKTILKKTHFTVAPRPHSGALPRRSCSLPCRPLHRPFAPPAGISTAPKRGSRSSSLSIASLARRSHLQHVELPRPSTPDLPRPSPPEWQALRHRRALHR
jgi:hypothetical protein